MPRLLVSKQLYYLIYIIYLILNYYVCQLYTFALLALVLYIISSSSKSLLVMSSLASRIYALGMLAHPFLHAHLAHGTLHLLRRLAIFLILSFYAAHANIVRSR